MQNTHPTLRVTGPRTLLFQNHAYACAVGENGFTDSPREGDKATPLGTYYLRECWYRPDRVQRPATQLPVREITPGDGWCDAPDHPAYNTHVKLPFPASHEVLWREDNIYDIMIPIGFNDLPVTPGLGSAIMFHLARPGYTPTLGCVAVGLKDMLTLLPHLSAQTQIAIAPSPAPGEWDAQA